jgi:CDGSH-type Zn-finger protein
MSRAIVHTETGPRRLDEDDIDLEKGDIAVCQCGLSEEYPFCDGSHRATEDESDDHLYKYEGDSADNSRYVAEIIRAEE